LKERHRHRSTPDQLTTKIDDYDDTLEKLKNETPKAFKRDVSLPGHVSQQKTALFKFSDREQVPFRIQ